MKLLITFACLFAVTVAVDEVSVLRKDLKVTAEGYNYAYELDNGILANEEGALKDHIAISAHGQFKFTSPEGQLFNIEYIADENGFQPSGLHLPVGPEIPILIQKSLDYLATAKPYVEKETTKKPVKV